MVTSAAINHAMDTVVSQSGGNFFFGNQRVIIQQTTDNLYELVICGEVNTPASRDKYLSVSEIKNKLLNFFRPSQ